MEEGLEGGGVVDHLMQAQREHPEGQAQQQAQQEKGLGSKSQGEQGHGAQPPAPKRSAREREEVARRQREKWVEEARRAAAEASKPAFTTGYSAADGGGAAGTAHASRKLASSPRHGSASANSRPSVSSRKHASAGRTHGAAAATSDVLLSAAAGEVQEKLRSMQQIGMNWWKVHHVKQDKQKALRQRRLQLQQQGLLGPQLQQAADGGSVQKRGNITNTSETEDLALKHPSLYQKLLQSMVEETSTDGLSTDPSLASQALLTRQQKLRQVQAKHNALSQSKAQAAGQAQRQAASKGHRSGDKKQPVASILSQSVPVAPGINVAIQVVSAAGAGEGQVTPVVNQQERPRERLLQQAGPSATASADKGVTMYTVVGGWCRRIVQLQRPG